MVNLPKHTLPSELARFIAAHCLMTEGLARTGLFGFRAELVDLRSSVASNGASLKRRLGIDNLCIYGFLI